MQFSAKSFPNNRFAHPSGKSWSRHSSFSHQHKVGNVVIKGFYSREQKLPPVGLSCQAPTGGKFFFADVKTFDNSRGHFALIVKNSSVVQSCAKML